MFAGRPAYGPARLQLGHQAGFHPSFDEWQLVAVVTNMNLPK
jgi:hypothetical protein